PVREPCGQVGGGVQRFPFRVVVHRSRVGEVEHGGAGVEPPLATVARREPLACLDLLHVTNIVGYMSDTAGDTAGTGKAAGKARDEGWDVGVRQTVAAFVPEVWRYLLSGGLHVWLGDIDSLPTARTEKYATRDGVVGEVRSYVDNSRIKLTWKPADWPHSTELQVSVRESVTGTTIVIQHDKLADREERRMMLGHWKNVIATLAAATDSL
ncbi:MAG: activator of Hsp90 ATPase 1 family protein, partial [Microbacteriaceae bacterium]|nr:activator of Hsp90 ATPase 1 family protein [Microbacteriaceae bacterium]